MRNIVISIILLAAIFGCAKATAKEAPRSAPAPAPASAQPPRMEIVFDEMVITASPPRKHGRKRSVASR